MNNEEPIACSGFFICAHARSGSTLLRYIVDTHPQICCPAELNLGSVLAEVERACRLTVGEVEGTIRTAQLGNEIMNAYCARKGKRIWFEKSADDVFHFALLRSAFPSARFVFLYRNCLDAVHSILEASRWGFGGIRADYVRRNPENLVAAMVECWCDIVSLLLACEAANSSLSLRVRYEDLVTHPAETIERLFSFAGADWKGAMLNDIFSAAHDDGPGDQKIKYASRIYTNRIDKGAALLANVPRPLRNRADQIGATIGYPPLGTPLQFNSAEVPAGGAFKSVESVFPEYVTRRKLYAGNQPPICAGFNISGEGGGSWKVRISGCSAEIVPDCEGTDCEFISTAEALLDIIEGKINIADAYINSVLGACPNNPRGW